MSFLNHFNQFLLVLLITYGLVYVPVLPCHALFVASCLLAGGIVKDPGEFSRFCILHDVKRGCVVMAKVVTFVP